MKKILFHIGILFTIILVMVGVAIKEKSIKDYIPTINTEAKIHYNYFTNGLIDLNSYFDIPDKGIYFIFGERYDYIMYRAYAGGLVEQDTLLCGNGEEKVNGYWAIKIEDGIVTESWSANYPLNENQLKPYTIEEQFKQMSLFEKFINSKAIGYYKAIENNRRNK